MARTVYGIVDGESPQVLHRLSSMSGRTQCGKPIVVLPDKPSEMPMCERCTMFDKAYDQVGQPQ